MAYEFVRAEMLRQLPGAGDRGAPPPIVGTVYYLRVGDLIKIGTSTNLALRLRQYPPDAVLLAVEADISGETERVRLQQFEHLRVARREWFRPAVELIKHIDMIAAANPDQSHGQALAPVCDAGRQELARRLGR